MNAKSTAAANTNVGEDAAVPTKFTIPCAELSDLMRMRGRQAARHITATYGGSTGLCARLWVSPTQGISTNDGDDLEQRIQAYGQNIIPPKQPKAFWELVLEALGDTTLVILLGSAVISLVMSMITEYAIPPERALSLPVTVEPNVEWIESVAILGTVCVVVFVTAFNDWSKERQFRSLQGRIESTHTISVLRDGAMGEIITSDILVGDVLQVKYGDLLPADGIVIQCNDLKIDESALTGETDQITKSPEKDPILLSGTHIMEGSGKMVVVAVGINSQAGIIFQLLGATAEAHNTPAKPIPAAAPATLAPKVTDGGESGANDTRTSATKPATAPPADGAAGAPPDEDEPDESGGRSILQAKLTKMALPIGMFGTIAASITVVALIIRFLIKNYGVEHHPARWTDISKLVEIMIIGITVVVVAVPEGLPLAVTLSLAFSVKKMMNDNNLVRHLDACETMGNATAICSDKTGTLTTNRMTTVQLFACSQYFRKIPNATMLPIPFTALLNNSMAVNTAYTSRIIPSETPGQIPQQAGNKTECALLGLIVALGDDYNLIRSMNPEASFVKIFTFHSGRKAMATLTRIGPNRIRVHVKGASERIVQWCTYVLDKQGQARSFDQNDGDHLIRNVIEPMASEGLRTLTMAYKDVIVNDDKSGGEVGEPSLNDDKIEPGETYSNRDPVTEVVTPCTNWYDCEQRVFSKLTLLAVSGIEDPVRDEVPEAIRKCQRAGITVRMVTGDNVNTARSIAFKCGILSGQDASELIMEGPDFNRAVRDPVTNKIRQHLIDEIWPRLRVLARSSPQDKYTLVSGIINSRVNPMREVVAVTGDGTNDGPALKKADVGFAMGIAGTDVAKEASDIILTDDNFSSIVKAVMWGRNIYDSIAKFLQFQLTVNVVAVVVVMLSSIIFNGTPLKAVQMLWVNLIMDTLGSLALATEPPTEELLNRKPYGRTKPLISRTMLKSIIGQATYQLLVITFIMLWGPEVFDFSTENEVDTHGTPQRHYTMVFNSFVFMTLCNQINARKIHNERNVLHGIQNNPIYVGILLFEGIAQVILTTFGSVAFQTTPLPIDLWLWCIFFGAFSLLWHQMLATIPSTIIPARFTMGKEVPGADENLEVILGYTGRPETPPPRGSVSNLALQNNNVKNNVGDSAAGSANSANNSAGAVDSTNNNAGLSSQQNANLKRSTRHANASGNENNYKKSLRQSGHHTQAPPHHGGGLSGIPIIGSLITGGLRGQRRIHEQVHEMTVVQDNLTRRHSPPLMKHRLSDTAVQDSLLNTAANRHSKFDLDPSELSAARAMAGASNLDVIDDGDETTLDPTTKLAPDTKASAVKVNEITPLERKPSNNPKQGSTIGVAAAASPAPSPSALATRQVKSSTNIDATPPATLPLRQQQSHQQVPAAAAAARRESLPPLPNNRTGQEESGQGSARMSPRNMTTPTKTKSPVAMQMSTGGGAGIHAGGRGGDDDELVFSTVEEANSMRSVGGQKPARAPSNPNWSRA